MDVDLSCLGVEALDTVCTYFAPILAPLLVAQMCESCWQVPIVLLLDDIIISVEAAQIL